MLYQGEIIDSLICLLCFNSHRFFKYHFSDFPYTFHALLNYYHAQFSFQKFGCNFHLFQKIVIYNNNVSCYDLTIKISKHKDTSHSLSFLYVTCICIHLFIFIFMQHICWSNIHNINEIEHLLHNIQIFEHISFVLSGA